MRISLFSLIRLSMIVAVLLMLTGVATNRLFPGMKPEWHIDNGQPWTVGQHIYNPRRGSNLVLETGSDRQIGLPSSIEKGMDLLSVSPFADQVGKRQMVCRIQRREETGTDLLPGAVELARMSFPDLDEIETRVLDWLPNSEPAWDLQTTRGLKTIFATGGGELVRVDWTDGEGNIVDHQGDLIQWVAERPYGEKTFVGDPHWLDDERFPDRLMVNIWGVSGGEKRTGLAWLELNADRSAIVDCGLLIDEVEHRPSSPKTFRYPVTRMSANGEMILAWQQRGEMDKGWSTFVGKLVIAGDDQTKRRKGFEFEWQCEVARGCLGARVGFDEALEHLYFIVPQSDQCYDGGQWRKRLLPMQVTLAGLGGRERVGGGRPHR